MKRFIIEWRQLREGCEHRFEDTFTALTLPLAIGQWQAKCYVNAEIVGVQLVERRGCAMDARLVYAVQRHAGLTACETAVLVALATCRNRTTGERFPIKAALARCEAAEKDTSATNERGN